jgi:hypothetical protein
MANAYYDYLTGLVGNSGLTPELPKATRDQAVTIAGAGDKVIALAGNQLHESGHFVFDDARIEEGIAFRTSILQPAAAELNYAARTSGNLTAANNPHKTSNLTFDASTGNSGAGALSAFDIIQDAVEDLTIQQHGTSYIAGTSNGLLISNRRGRVELVDCKISGSPSVALLNSSASLSGDGAEVIDIQGLELSGSRTAGIITGVTLTKIDNLTNTLDLLIKGVKGTLTATGTASAIGMNIKSVNPKISNFDLKLVNTGSGTGDFGLLIQGQVTAVATLPVVSNGKIDYACANGHAISIGQSTAAGNVTGGEVIGNEITGRYYATNTPHGITLGQATSATARGNTVRDIYAGYLASKTTSGTIEGNVAFDCYGVSFYAKGTTAHTIQDNIAIISGKFVPSSTYRLGVLAVAPQTPTNTVAVTFTRNLVIVSDITKINGLAYIEDVNQVCSFDNNTYIIPDTVDITSALLFTYENGAGGAPNQTLAQWNANAEVGTDKIIQLPAAEISKMINTYRIQSGNTGRLLI